MSYRGVQIFVLNAPVLSYFVVLNLHVRGTDASAVS
jgi:hypothetical protein